MNTTTVTAARPAHPWPAAALLRMVAILALAFVMAAQDSWSQVITAPRESSIKAAFLVKFASFVEWPASAFARAGQPLVIGVSDDDEFHSDLEQLVNGRTVDERPVVVRKIAEGAVPTGVHVLYLGQRRDSRLRELIQGIKGPVLIVTSQAQGLQAGSVINFSSEGGRVRFSASLAAAERHQLRLSARLLAVAQFIDGGLR
ncbi:MAG: YfiR family protein [Pseudomonadota bacterium]